MYGHIYHCSANFHGQNLVIWIRIHTIWNFAWRWKMYPPAGFAMRLSWSCRFTALTNRMLLVLKVTSVVWKVCFIYRYTNDNRQLTVFGCKMLGKILIMWLHLNSAFTPCCNYHNYVLLRAVNVLGKMNYSFWWQKLSTPKWIWVIKRQQVDMQIHF